MVIHDVLIGDPSVCVILYTYYVHVSVCERARHWEKKIYIYIFIILIKREDEKRKRTSEKK